jgi:radical SAM superfamily enzyme YgiQ (UPF0313 family)
MDILLLFPPLSVEERYGNRKLGEIGGHLPPFGLACIASYIREHSFSVGIMDALAEDMEPMQVLDYIGKHQPKVIGFSAMTPQFLRTVRIAKDISKRFPEILTIIGGHHASIMPYETLEEDCCLDLLVYGEGEETFLEIINKYKERGWNKEEFLKDADCLKAIDGIAFRDKDSNIKINKSRRQIEDLDSLPSPAWDLLPLGKYIPLPNQYLNKPVIHMVSIRGCPFDCDFCSNNSVFGRKIRARSPERVVDDIKYVKSKYNMKEISFWDDTMTVNKKWLEKFCNCLIENKVNVTWTCYSRVDTVNLEILKLMKKAGCWNIFYGYESGNQQLLDNINKGITLEQIRNANKWTKEAGIEVRASFMIALPGETPEMAKKTIDFAIELEPEYAQFSITTPYPGTKLFDTAKKSGRLREDFSKYNMWEVVYVPEGYMDEKQIVAIEKLAMRKFYFRFRFIFEKIKRVRSFEDIRRYINGLKMAIGFAT